jgi:L,D-transpeptidase ErfK/SrfK
MLCRGLSLVCLILTLSLYPLITSARSHHHGEGVPEQISPPGEKVIIVDPNIHAWAAYDADGQLVRSGLATAGSNYCRDLHRRCHTRSGSFRIYSLGSSSCRSHKFPLPRGGAPMPYCMYFNGGQALHGSPEGEVVYGNISHGCVRLHVDDAAWLRFDFVDGPNAENSYKGTRVIVKPY